MYSSVQLASNEQACSNVRLFFIFLAWYLLYNVHKFFWHDICSDEFWHGISFGMAFALAVVWHGICWDYLLLLFCHFRENWVDYICNYGTMY